MTVLSRRDEFACHSKVIGVVEDEQPALVRAKPALNGVHSERLVLGVGFWQLQEARNRQIGRDERLPRMGGVPLSLEPKRTVSSDSAEWVGASGSQYNRSCRTNMISPKVLQ